MRRKILLAVVLALLIAVAAIAGMRADKYADALADQKAKFNSSQTELKQVHNQLQESKQEQVEEKDASEQQIQKLEQEKKDLEGKLQAKIEQKVKLAAAQPVAASVPSVRSLAPSIVSGCGENTFANHIYMHESSCSLTVTNAEGCIGIGQACPASKLLAICPDLSYSCQNEFFTGYAVARYGSWEGAYNFWLANRWW